jgi:hemerythrin
MALVGWDENFSLGLPLFDAQHQLIAETLNELHSAIMKSAPRNKIALLLHSLVGYTRSHFAAEEAAMAATHYPDLARHHELHDEILQRATKLVTGFDRGQASPNLLVLNFVRDSLHQHIVEVDRLYAPWLSEHGAFQSDSAAHCSNDDCVGANIAAAFGSEARS